MGRDERAVPSFPVSGGTGRGQRESVQRNDGQPGRRSRRPVFIAAALLLCALAALIVFVAPFDEAPEEAREAPIDADVIAQIGGTEEIPAVEYAYRDAKDALARACAGAAGDALDDGLPQHIARRQWLDARIEPYMGALEIADCRIEGSDVAVTVKSDRIVLSDDGLYHIYAQDMTQGGAEGEEVASCPAPEDTDLPAELTVRFPLGKDTASSNLLRRFYAGVMSGGETVAVSTARYIGNPEACADRTAARNDHGKKGILPAAALIRQDGLRDLGVQQAIYNLTLGSICAGSGINYVYNGKTYSFSASLISQYDIVVRRLNDQGAQVTMVVLNDPAGDASMLHPRARGGSAHYYAFNTAEQAAVERLAAAASFLADRYSGTGHGTVDNWIIGNEVNARSDWNYMTDPGIDAYAQAYADAFRIFYNAILSRNANARIYVSIDQQWARPLDASRYYAGRDLLQRFGEAVKREGDLDWHVAVHPYNVPLYDPYAWHASDRAPHSEDAAFLTMRNIDVLTDWLGRPDMLDSDGEVRSVLCSEVGYTSSNGQDIQAASIVYGYLQAMHNSHIDGFILSRELDDGGEVAQGLAYGLRGGGGPKTAYAYYRAMGTAEEQQYVEMAMATMGVTDMADILTER